MRVSFVRSPMQRSNSPAIKGQRLAIPWTRCSHPLSVEVTVFYSVEIENQFFQLGSTRTLGDLFSQWRYRYRYKVKCIKPWMHRWLLDHTYHVHWFKDWVSNAWDKCFSDTKNIFVKDSLAPMNIAVNKIRAVCGIYRKWTLCCATIQEHGNNYWNYESPVNYNDGRLLWA